MWSIKNILPTQKARALFLAAILFVSVGFTNYVTADELKPSQPGYRAYAAQFSMFPDLKPWGAFFMLAGVVAMVSALAQKYYVGFFALMAMSTWWAGLFTASLAMNGYTRIIPSILTWALISVFLYTISSWPAMVTQQDVDKAVVKKLEGELES